MDKTYKEITKAVENHEVKDQGKVPISSSVGGWGFGTRDSAGRAAACLFRVLSSALCTQLVTHTAEVRHPRLLCLFI